MWFFFFSGMCEQWDSLQMTGRQKSRLRMVKNRAYKLRQRLQHEYNKSGMRCNPMHGISKCKHVGYVSDTDFSSEPNNTTLSVFAPKSINWRGASTERSVRWAARHFDGLWQPSHWGSPVELWIEQNISFGRDLQWSSSRPTAWPLHGWPQVKACC